MIVKTDEANNSQVQKKILGKLSSPQNKLLIPRQEVENQAKILSGKQRTGKGKKKVHKQVRHMRQSEEEREKVWT